MAKKKTRKKTAKEKMPDLEDNMVSVSFTKEELATFANLMSTCAKTFEMLAVQAAQQNDESSSNIFVARYKLSNIYADRLLSSFSIGEPPSRDVH